MNGIIIVLLIFAMVKFLFSDNPGDGVVWSDNGFRYMHRSKLADAIRGIAKASVLFILLAAILVCCSGM